MKTTFIPEYLFIEASILFIFNKVLSDFLITKLKKEQQMISIDAPTLWEVKEDQLNNRKLLLHLDLPYYFEPLTIDFTPEHSNLIEQNQNIETVGILLNLNEEQSEAENVIFVLGINEGLNIL